MSTATLAMDKEDTPEEWASRPPNLLSSLKRSPAGVAGVIIALVVVMLAVGGQWIEPHNPATIHLDIRFEPPVFAGGSWTYPLGTDHLGRDILSRLIAGTRISGIVGVVSALLAGVFGVVYGLVAGYFGGLIDDVMMRIVDAFLGIPFVVMVVALSGVIGAGLITLIVVLALASWVPFARVTRAEVSLIKRLEYITAARLLDQTTWRILRRHVLPNAIGAPIVLAALQVGYSILAESALSFLGLGVQPPDITWGLILADGRDYMTSAWWLTAFPGVAITFTVLGAVLVGDWLRTELDPRLRSI